MDIDIYMIAAMVAAALLVGFSKTSFPTLGIIAVTIMALVFPAKLSIGLLLPMLIVGDIYSVITYRRTVIWKHLISLIPWVLGGLIVGFVVLIYIDSPTLQMIIGVVVVSLVILHVVKQRMGSRIEDAIHGSSFFAIVLGSLAGFTTMIGNAAGGIMAIFLLSKGLSKAAFVGTGAWFFMTVNLIKVPFYVSLGIINTETLVLNLWMIPAILAGAWIGVRVLRFVPERLFVIIILSAAFAGGLRLIWG